MISVELALIGAILTSQEAYYKIDIELKPDMFENPDLAWVFDAMQQLALKGIAIDMVMVENYMRRINPKRYAETNGITFLMDDLLSVRHDGNIREYAVEIFRLYRHRTLCALFRTVSLKAAQAEGEPDDLIADLDRQLADFIQTTARGNEMVPLHDVLTEAVEIHRRRVTGEQKTALRSGLEEVDFVTGGFYPTELTVLGGRPSDGKTAVALQMALNIARAGHHVCFFSLEMSSFQLANRILLNMTNVDPMKLRKTLPDENDLDALDKAASQCQLPFYLDYTSCSTLETIRRKAFQRSRMGQCDMIVIDYLHLISATRQKGQSQDEYIGSITLSLKRLAIELNCPVLVLSQMNRQCENRSDRNYMPQMNDLRDSGNIEQAADCIMFVYRLDRRGIDTDPMTGEPTRGMGKIIISKNRNGAIGFARFRHNTSFTRLTNYIYREEKQNELFS